MSIPSGRNPNSSAAFTNSTGVVVMASAHEHVGVQVSELRHDRGDVLDVLGVGLHREHFHAVGFQVFDSAVRHRRRERGCPRERSTAVRAPAAASASMPDRV